MAEDYFALQDRLAAIQAAYDQGINEIDVDGQRIRYRNLDDMARVITNLRGRIDQALGTGGTTLPPSVRSVKVSSAKGIQ